MKDDKIKVINRKERLAQIILSLRDKTIDLFEPYTVHDFGRLESLLEEINTLSGHGVLHAHSLKHFGVIDATGND